MIDWSGSTRPAQARRSAGAACCASVLAVVATLALALTPASALVATVHGHGYGIAPAAGVGAVPLVNAYRAVHKAGRPGNRVRRFDEPPGGGSALENAGGGPVMHSVTTHVIYWDPEGRFGATTKAIVAGFFGDVALDGGKPTNTFAIAGQYTDATGNAAYSSTFAGARADRAAYPTSGNCTVPKEPFADEGPPYTTCLFDAQLQSELTSFVEAEGLPTGPEQLYLVLLPHEVVTCLEEEIEGKPVCSNNFFCAYHSFIAPGTAHEIVYADIPFSLLDSESAKGCQADGNARIQLPSGDEGSSDAETRFADVALKYASHEYIEAETDPLVGFETAWVDEEGLEIADKCNSVPFRLEEVGEPGFDRHAFTPVLGGSAEAGTLFDQSIAGGRFYLQSEWDNAARACLMAPLELGNATFTSSSGATAGTPVTFAGGASDPYGALQLSWSFGDGATATGAAPSHTFAVPGEYTVTLTPRDALTGSTGPAAIATVKVAVAPAPVAPAPVAPVAARVANSRFAAAKVSVNAKTGVVTLTTSVADPGTLSFAATFPNGRFGAFASAARCRKGRIRLGWRCLPATVLYAKGARTLAAPGAARIALKPGASALKALKRALAEHRSLPLTIVLRFQSANGGAPFSVRQTATVRPKRR